MPKHKFTADERRIIAQALKEHGSKLDQMLTHRETYVPSVVREFESDRGTTRRLAKMFLRIN